MALGKELNSLQRCCLDPLLLGEEEEEDNINTRSGAPTATRFDSPAVDGQLVVVVAKEEGGSQKQRQQKPFQLYGATFACLIILERWLEFADRPTESIFHHICTILVVRSGDDEKYGGSGFSRRSKEEEEEEEEEKVVPELQKLWRDPVDDVKKLQWVVNQVRRVLLWKRAPDPSLDPHLTIQESKIPKAQLGLFADEDLPANAICCYYSGDIHSTKSSQSTTGCSTTTTIKMLKDSSYLLRIGSIARQPWWYKSLLATGPDDDDSTTTGDDDCFSSAYSALREEWDRIMASTTTTTTTEVFFVDPSTNPNIKARYINDCLNPNKYNVQFVMDPIGERAAVVTLRPIQKGEELYVSYGQSYWDSIEATTGIVPQQLI